MEKIFNVLVASRQCNFPKLEELAKITAEMMDELELQVTQKILGYPTPME